MRAPPLALRIAGARLADEQHRTVTDYVAQLLTGDRIAALAVDDDLAVRAAFDLSYRTLPPVARLVFRRLGLVPCPDFTVAAAAALADIGGAEASHALEALTTAHLVVRLASGRYAMPDLLREYAADVAAEQDCATEREAATRRLHDLLFGPSSAAAALLSPDRRGKPRNGHRLRGLGLAPADHIGPPAGRLVMLAGGKRVRERTPGPVHENVPDPGTHNHGQ